jgi:hypothetical protein
MEKKPRSLGEKMKRACSFKSKKKKEKYDVKDIETSETIYTTHEYTTLPFAYSMADDRVIAEEKCLVQQTRIMEQIREMKKVDLELFHFESICQNQTDEEFDKNDEILRLEHLYRISERIIDLHNMIEKADKTIEVMSLEINQYRDVRSRSYSEPVNQSTPVKPRITDAADSAPPPVVPFVRSHSIKRTNRFDTIYRSTKSKNPPVTKLRSQSYRETRSEINTNVPLLRTTPNLFFRANRKERRLPIPVEIPKVPEFHNLKNGEFENAKKKSFHPRLVIERKKELDLSIKRSASDVAISDKLTGLASKLTLPTSKSERKLNSCDTDSDTGVSSMHSSETEFRFSPDRNDRKITLV